MQDQNNPIETGPNQSDNIAQTPQASKSNSLLITLLCILFVVLVVGGYYYYVNYYSKPKYVTPPNFTNTSTVNTLATSATSSGDTSLDANLAAVDSDIETLATEVEATESGLNDQATDLN